MSKIPEQAFILAAGKGTRLRPLTDNMPKPMVEVSGRSIINRTLDKLEEIGVKRVIVNLRYLAEKLEEHLGKRETPEIVLSKETEELETGGGVLNALHLLQNTPFYLINGDALWSDNSGEETLSGLAAAYNDDEMDMLLLLHEASKMKDGSASGDYDLDEDRRATRSLDKTGRYMFTGIRITHPRVMEGSQEGSFTFRDIMDKCEKEGTLFGKVHGGEYFHISTIKDLEETEEILGEKKNWAKK